MVILFYTDNSNFHSLNKDVAVDIRPNSPTFGKWHGILLDSKDKTNFWIPDGIL
jgi:dTDP-4-dehydrorhamnose 3,5-epimerase-like enzyme